MYRQNSCVLQEIRVREHDCDVRFLTGSRNKAIRACAIKNKQFGPYLWPTRQNCLSYRKTGSANTTVTSGFLQEVEIRLLCAFAIKICNLAHIYGRIASRSWSMGAARHGQGGGALAPHGNVQMGI